MKKEIVLGLFAVLILVGIVLASDCVFEKESCEYPGDCGNYIDNNKNGLCDNSESEIGQEKIGSVIEQANERGGKNYPVLWIGLVTILLYIISYLLVRFGKIKIITHRKIWNIVLLVSFLISAGLGLILAVNIQYGLGLLSGVEKLEPHVNAGVVLVIVGLLHALCHWSYYKNLLKR